MKTELYNVDSQVVNRAFVEKIESGRIKEAADEFSLFVRAKMREEEIVQSILPPMLVTEDQLDRDVNTDEPKVIVEKEIDSVATYVPFKGSGRNRWYTGDRYEVFFGKVESERFNKSKFQLMSYRHDIRKLLADNSVFDIGDQVDTKFFALCEDVMTANPTQDLSPTGGFTPTNVKLMIQNMLSRKIPLGHFVMTKSLYAETLDWPATSISDDIAKEKFRQGIDDELQLFGVPVKTTIKNDIVSDTDAWLFGPAGQGDTRNYLGHYFYLQEPTLFIKQEADIITFWTYSAPGIGISGTAAITRASF